VNNNKILNDIKQKSKLKIKDYKKKLIHLKAKYEKQKQTKKEQEKKFLILEESVVRSFLLRFICLSISLEDTRF